MGIRDQIAGWGGCIDITSLKSQRIVADMAKIGSCLFVSRKEKMNREKIAK
jgi:hypothetical protein